jgi:ribose 5-phosphate isomerase B
MKLVSAGDSAGKPLVDLLPAHLAGRGTHEIIDLNRPDDGRTELHAVTTERAAGAIPDGRADRDIFCCGLGIAVCISANKISGTRAALVHETCPAERAALSNDAQIITTGAREIGPELANAVVDAWLDVSFGLAGTSAAPVHASVAVNATHAHAP